MLRHLSLLLILCLMAVLPMGCGGGADLNSTGTVAVTVEPATLTLAAGSSYLFKAAVKGAKDGSVTWTSTGGTIDATTGLFTAPLTAGQFLVVAASKADPGKAGQCTVTVTAPLDRKVVITPLSGPLKPGDPQVMTAKVLDEAGVPVTDQQVAWSVQNSPAGGTINSSTGLYIAPTTSGVYTIVASTVATPIRTGTLQVAVTPPPEITVSLSPKDVKMAPGSTQVFVASVANASNSAVTWSVLEGSTGGVFLNGTGLYQAPTTPGTYHVVATSVENPARLDTTSVTVTYEVLPITVSIVPSSKALAPKTTFSFTAVVTGSPDTSVTWRVDNGFGTIDATGLYTAPDSPGLATVRAVSKANPAIYATADVTVTQSRVSLTPSGTQLMAPGETRAFTAVVIGPDGQPMLDQRVGWSQILPTPLSPVTTIAPYLYTAPTVGSTALLRATSIADPTAFMDVPIEVSSAAFTVSPGSALVPISRGIQFTSNKDEVSWAVTGAAGGSITPGGYYQAPNTLGGSLAFMEDTVTATFLPNPILKVPVRVLVSPLLVAPDRKYLSAGAVQTFTASTATGMIACTWTALYFPPGGGQPEDFSAAMSSQNSTSSDFTVPAKSGTYRIRAVPVATPTFYGEAEVIVP